MSIPVDPDTGLVGTLKDGDHVDMLMAVAAANGGPAFTRPLLRNVLVLTAPTASDAPRAVKVTDVAGRRSSCTPSSTRRSGSSSARRCRRRTRRRPSRPRSTILFDGLTPAQITTSVNNLKAFTKASTRPARRARPRAVGTDERDRHTRPGLHLGRVRRPRRGPAGARHAPGDRDRRHRRRARPGGPEARSRERAGRPARLEPHGPHAGRGRRGDPPGDVRPDRARHHQLGDRPAAGGALARRRRHRAAPAADRRARLHHPPRVRDERAARPQLGRDAHPPRHRGQDRQRLLAQGRGRAHHASRAVSPRSSRAATAVARC